MSKTKLPRKRLNNFAYSLSLFLFSICFGKIIFADHLPDHLIAKGKPEKQIAGISIDRTKLKDIIAMYGKYTKASGDEYLWRKSDVILRVNMIVGSNKASDYIVSIEVSGKKTIARISSTGAGLKLGDSLADLQRLYGKKYQIRRTNKRLPQKVNFEWKDTRSLIVDFDASGKINKLTLLAGE